MAEANPSTDASHQGPMMYLSTSEGGRTPTTLACIIALGTVFPIFAAMAMGARFYCRLCLVKSHLGVDDWLMLAAFGLTLGMGVIMIVGGSLHALAAPTPEGWGPTDYFWVTDDAEIITEKLFWAFIIVQCWAFGFAKLSVLWFYRRIFCGRKFQIANNVLIALVSLWTLGFFFAYVFRCGTKFWALWAPLEDLVRYCYNGTPMFYSLSITDVITDLLILSLPFFWVWKLNMSREKRVAVSMVFLLGAIEIATGIARLVVFVQQSTNYLETADGIGLLTTMMVWSMAEIGIAVVAGCLPTIWPLVRGVSLRSMLDSFRSAVTLQRLRSTWASSRSTINKSRKSGESEGDLPLSEPKSGV